MAHSLKLGQFVGTVHCNWAISANWPIRSYRTNLRARSTFTTFIFDFSNINRGTGRTNLSGRHHGNKNNSHPPPATARHKADLPVRLQPRALPLSIPISPLSAPLQFHPIPPPSYHTTDLPSPVTDQTSPSPSSAHPQARPPPSPPSSCPSTSTSSTCATISGTGTACASKASAHTSSSRKCGRTSLARRGRRNAGGIGPGRSRG